MLRLRVLGSGDAFNAGGALHSAYLLEHDDGRILLESGPSVLAGLKSTGIDPDTIDGVMISHLHGDHFGGVPFLLLEYMFKSCRTRPFKVAGPPTTLDRIRSVYAGLYKEEHFHRMEFAIEETVVHPGDKFDFLGFAVEAFEVEHIAEPFCLGYRIRAGGATVAFSGDSAWSPALEKMTEGADLFLCECCSLERETDFHTAYCDIRANRHKIKAKRTLLTHLGADVRSDAEARPELAHDGMVIDIGE